MSEIERKDQSTSVHIPVDWQVPEDFPTDKVEEIPYNEGMALYYQIKERHGDLFRKLADL